MTKQQQIDQLLSEQYSASKYSELGAVSKFFKQSFLEKLEKILNSDCVETPQFSERYQVRFGWIDKIPLAEFCNEVRNYHNKEIKTKVELGDVMFVYNKTFKNKTTREEKKLDSRAIIVQAKLASKENPKVPIARMIPNKVCSTSKELALLSSWPEFNLYQTSRSNKTLLDNINLDKNMPNRKFAGYHNKKWYFGNPNYEETCNTSFGQFLLAFTKKEEGEKYNEVLTTDWDRLIAQIIKVCNDYSLPYSLFGKKRKRIIGTNHLYSTPLLLFFWFLPTLFTRRKFKVLTRCAV